MSRPYTDVMSSGLTGDTEDRLWLCLNKKFYLFSFESKIMLRVSFKTYYYYYYY